MEKNVNSAFIGTNLADYLATIGNPPLVIVGMTSDQCVNTTVRMAGNLGYESYMVSDATATFNKTDHNGKAFSADQLHEVALASIHDHEQGHPVSLGDSQWENELKKDLSTKFKPAIPERINLSASAIETFESCPLKFRLGRLDGIPQTARKPELVFGNIIHAVLQRFHEPGKELSEDRILRLLDEEWKKGEFDYTVREEKFREQGEEILSRYCVLAANNPPEVIKREETFTFEIGPIKTDGRRSSSETIRSEQTWQRRGDSTNET